MANNQLPDGWKLVHIDDIAEKKYGLVDGPFGSNLPASDYVSFGIPVIRGSNLTLGNGRFRSGEFVYVSNATAQRLARSLCRADDIIFTKKGTLGQTGLIPLNNDYDTYLLSSNQMKLTVDRALAYPLFIYYYVSSPASQAKISRDSEATGVPKINLAYLKTFPLLLPPLPEQRAIAHILGSLDDKIELNRRMNETLEGIAQAIFKAWFVDFEPVRAKMAGEQPFGMDEATAALFPDRLIDSGTSLGEIPAGWRIGKLSDVADITMGQSPPGDTYNETEDGLPFYQGVRDFGYRFPSRRVYCTAPTRFAEEGDVLLSVRAPVGSLNIAGERCVIGRGVAALRLKTKPGGFLYYLMKANQIGWAKFEAEGTVFGAANKTDVHNFEVIVPLPEVIQKYGQIVNPVDELIKANEQQSRTLAAIRDALLPKLLSGEIRVAEAEELAAAAM